MGRIKPEDNVTMVVVKMSQGNPGCAMVLSELLKDERLGALQVLLLDDLKIYGSNVWVLYKNCCHQDIEIFSQVLEKVRTGKVNLETIKMAMEESQSLKCLFE